MDVSDNSPGEIITFYSYKGGTGRSMALGNVACLLAKEGKNVLMIDWDLEAPGLHRFFFQHKFYHSSLNKENLEQYFEEINNKPGLIDFFREINEELDRLVPESKNEESNANDILNKVKLKRFIVETHIPNLSILKAGSFDKRYSDRVNTFNWENFYYKCPSLIPLLAQKLAEHYSYVLIDSRTGFTDMSGISTMLMPTKLVVVLTPNRQSSMGIEELISKATKYRGRSEDFRPLLIYPLPSRIEASLDKLRRAWRFGSPEQGIHGYQPMFERIFKEIYGLEECNLDDYFREVFIQQSPYYAYGEEIAVLEDERKDDRASLSDSYKIFTKWLVNSVGPWQLSEYGIKESLTTPFKGEKSYFVGRSDYILNIMKEYITTPGSCISIIGAGGTGKSQLAFKAIRYYYEKEQLFDLIISLYFDDRLMSFNEFLSKIAMGLDTIELSKFDDLNIEERIANIRNALSKKKHPLIFADSFDNVSFIINNSKLAEKESTSSLNDAISIKYFLENELPGNTSILLTSRIRNNLRAEKQIELEGLNLEESKKLFSLLSSDEQLKNPTPFITQKIDKLLQQTGGHPLTIEILAKNITSAEEIDDIIQHFTITIKTNLDEPIKRLQSLKNSLDYTLDKLDNNLNKILQKLSFFKSPFPIFACEKILNAKKSEILNLYTHSLLMRIDSDDVYGKIEDSEYWLYNFHSAVRNYIEDLVAANRINIEDAYYEKRFYYCYYEILYDTLISIGKENHVPSFARFNIIYQTGEDNDFDRCIRLAENYKDLSYGAKISSAIGVILHTTGDLFKALQYNMKALSFNEKIGNREELATNYNNIGILHQDMGNSQEALVFHNKALEIDKELNNSAGLARDYSNIGIILNSIGKRKDALEYYNKALEIDKELNNSAGLARDYSNIGIILNSIGKRKDALEYYMKSLQINTDLNDKFSLNRDYANIGNVYRNLLDYSNALEYYKRALNISEQLNDKVGMAKDYNNIGMLNQDMGNSQEALVFHNKALEIDKELNDKVGLARDYDNIGLVLSNLGKYQQALVYHKKALEINKELSNEFEIVSTYRNIGLVLSNLGKYQQALEYHNKALEIDKELNNNAGLARDYDNIGLVLSNLGKYQQALEYHNKALEIDKELNNRAAISNDYRNIGIVYYHIEDNKRALFHYKQALGIYETNLKANQILPQVFINYSKNDEKAALRLYSDLKNVGLNPWIDKKNILPGESWKNAIEEAIRNSQFFISLFSIKSFKLIQSMENEEFVFAMEVFKNYMEHNKIVALPGRLDDCEIPYQFLKDLHPVDLFEFWEDGIKQFIKAITKKILIDINDEPMKNKEENLVYADNLLELLRIGNINAFNETRPKGHLNLDGANLENAKLHRVNFSNTSLIKAVIKGGDLTEANLTNANLDNANLTNANFSNAILGGRISLSGAIVDNAKFNNADLSDAHFFGTSVKGADFNKAHFTNFQQNLKDDLRKRGALNVPD